MADTANTVTEPASPRTWNHKRRVPELFRLVDGRLILFAGTWLVIAFVLRPILIDAHAGGSGVFAEALRVQLPVFGLARIAGIVEWLSFVLPLGLIAMLQTRTMAQPQLKETARSSFGWAASYAVVLLVGFVVFLWGRSSVITLMTHDTFIFVDAIYRIQHGQVPSVDFHTPIGAAALYGPAFGAWLADGFAGSIEIASALLAFCLALACGWACAARANGAIASILVVVVFLVVAPMGLLADWPGESATVIAEEAFNLRDQLTIAMFYNRWGWGALIVILTFLPPRRDGERPWSEIALLVALLTFLFYLKLSYFVVASAAALTYAVIGIRPRMTAAVGIACTVVLVLAIGLPGGLFAGYLSEILSAASVSGNRSELLAPVLRRELLPLLVALTSIVLIGVADRLTWRDVLVASVIILGSMFIVNQNAQTGAICSLIALPVYSFCRFAGAEQRIRLAALTILALVAAPFVLERMMVLMDRSTAIRREEAREPPAWAGLEALDRVHVPERESALNMLRNLDGVEDGGSALAVLGIMGRRQELRQGEYMELVLAGLDELSPVVASGESVVAVDMSNPFSSLIGSRPARGDWLSLHEGRTFGEDSYPPPEVIFADADHVMLAKLSMLQSTAQLALALYDPWLSANFAERAESKYWVRYSREQPTPPKAQQLRGFTRTDEE